MINNWLFFCETLCFMLDTVCPAFFSVGEFHPLIFKCSKRALDFGGGRGDHYHFAACRHYAFEDQRLKMNLWFLSIFQIIKVSKCPLVSAAGLCDPHQKTKMWHGWKPPTPHLSRSKGQNDPLILHIPLPRSTVQFGPLIFKLSQW